MKVYLAVERYGQTYISGIDYGYFSHNPEPSSFYLKDENNKSVMMVLNSMDEQIINDTKVKITDSLSIYVKDLSCKLFKY